MGTSNTGFAQSVVQFVRDAIKKFLALLGKTSTPPALPASDASKPTGSAAPTPQSTAPSATLPAVTKSDSGEVRVAIPDEILGPGEEAKLALLYPPFAARIRLFVLEARRRKMAVGIFDAHRTFERQAELYAQGRTTPGKIVTRARPGFSFHCYGVAVDLVFDGDVVKPGWQWSWSDRFPWAELSILGREFGLEPAFNWPSFPEAPHYQWTFGYTEKECLAVYEKGGLKAVWSLFDNPRKPLKLLS